MKGFDSVQMLTTVYMYVCMYVCIQCPLDIIFTWSPMFQGGYSVTLAYHCSFVDVD